MQCLDRGEKQGRKGFREAIGRATGNGPLRMNRSLSGETLGKVTPGGMALPQHWRLGGLVTLDETERGFWNTNRKSV